MQESNINNNVLLMGKVLSEFEFNHRVYSEGFYYFLLEVKRLSDSFDIIPIIISERLLTSTGIKKDDYVILEGQFRSYNNYIDDGNKLVLNVFVRSIRLSNETNNLKNPNYIYLNGFVCKPTNFRTTPFGREITDILLAVNRAYNKSDYIPCIAWGRNARFSQSLNVGDSIKVWGRIQSREYQKKLSEEEIINKTAYEVSISKMEVSNINKSLGE